MRAAPCGFRSWGGGGVTGLAYSPDGRTVYTLDAGGWVTAWDVASRAGKRLFQLRPNERYSGRQLLTVGERYLVIPVTNTARVWDAVAGGLLPDMPPNLCFGRLYPLRDRPAVQFVAADRGGLDCYDIPTGAGDATARQAGRAGRTPAGRRRAGRHCDHAR